MRIVIAFIVAVSAGASAASDSSFAAGFGASNAACGSGVPTAWLRWERESDASPARVHVRTGPDGGCAGQSTSVDASAARRLPLRGPWSLSVTGGYDQRVLPVEYGCDGRSADCVPLPGKLFRGAEVVTVSALLGVVYDGGDWSIELRYDAVEHDWADGGGVPPISAAYRHRFGPVVLAADVMARGVGDVSVAWESGRLRAAVAASANASLLAHPAPPFVSAGGRRWERLGAPDVVYDVEFGVRF